MPKSADPDSDLVLRKQKNASAQAAFRARRANYIATLEETGKSLPPLQVLRPLLTHPPTVTSLESVVIQLQESCRDARNDALHQRHENARLRIQFRERERFWRSLCNSRNAGGHAPETDDLPPPPSPSPYLGHPHPTGPPLVQYPSPLACREDSTPCHSAYNPSPNFPSSSPGVPPFANNDVSAEAASHRVGKFTPYPFQINAGASRDPRWHSIPAGLPNAESGTPSPSITSTDMSSYSARFSAADEQKAALNSVLDSAPFVFPNGDRFHQNAGDSVPNSRSMSPTTQSTPNSSTSMSLTSSFPFTFHEPLASASAGQESSEFDYRRHSLPHCPEMTLHGGTADISLTGQPAHDAVRYRVGERRPESGADYQPMLSPHQNPQNPDHNSSDGEHSFNDSRSRARRHTIPSHSRSPSPGPTPISCTVAVIKAQAFGALRRTRAKTKKSAEGAARLAMDVLEARGIGVGGSTGTKRPRLEDDDINTGTP
ncbi:hypothetical protein BDN70DRAFT_930916 [Pholiota conissans]|uniref:BZIP domain-containing protein n=1 Tax=Pholiota conissans TaxID=109636 RepID=A0A9P5Z4S5_9AGAR|nr:hypothetical protein BDN70DRAFT_930916 [Pholiota conissans]